MLPGHASQQPGLKLTCDAASLKNAPKSYKQCTSAIVQLLSFGIVGGDWGNAVTHMVTKPQSAKNCWLSGLWFGKDDAVNCKEHLAPQMEEALHLEQDKEGMHADLPQSLPPWTVTTDEHGRRTQYVKREVYQMPDVKANARKMRSRNVIARNVQLFVCFMFCLDGATLGAVAGTPMQSKHPDPFSSEEDKDLGEFHEIWSIKRKEKLSDLAERFCPGCTDPQSKHHWMWRYILSINNHRFNNELQTITREPPREEELCVGVGQTRTNKIKRTERQLSDADNDDGRTDTRLPYRDANLVSMGYDHESFVPAIDGDCATTATMAKKNGAVRMPIHVVHGKRELPNAIFGQPRKSAGLRQESTGAGALIWKFGLCIVHCGMRTIESCLAHLLKQAMDRYAGGKKADLEAVAIFHEALRTKLRVNKLIRTDKEGKLLKPSVPGEEVQSIFTDLLSGDSELIKAVTALYEAMGLQPEATKLTQWEVVLTHWAKAMQAAYKLRPTQEDRDIFREHSRFYVMRKANIRSKICTWYDWQCYSVLPDIFDRSAPPRPAHSRLAR